MVKIIFHFTRKCVACECTGRCQPVWHLCSKYHRRSHRHKTKPWDLLKVTYLNSKAWLLQSLGSGVYCGTLRNVVLLLYVRLFRSGYLGQLVSGYLGWVTSGHLGRMVSGYIGQMVSGDYLPSSEWHLLARWVCVCSEGRVTWCFSAECLLRNIILWSY